MPRRPVETDRHRVAIELEAHMPVPAGVRLGMLERHFAVVLITRWYDEATTLKGNLRHGSHDFSPSDSTGSVAATPQPYPHPRWSFFTSTKKSIWIQRIVS